MDELGVYANCCSVELAAIKATQYAGHEQGEVSCGSNGAAASAILMIPAVISWLHDHGQRRDLRCCSAEACN